MEMADQAAHVGRYDLQFVLVRFDRHWSIYRPRSLRIRD